MAKMPLVRVNVEGDRLTAPEQVQGELHAALTRTSPGAPVVVMIHGYKFSPAFEPHSPHSHILSLSPARDDWKALSWPRALGLGSDAKDEPLCIAFGWEARGSLWHAYERAAKAGRALAALIVLVRRLRPEISVDVLAHSLGCRVALSALPHLPARSMGRAVLMAPAELRSRAIARLDSVAGRSVEVLSITSRENGVYDRLLEWLLAPLRFGDRSLGAGLSHLADNWIDVNIDHRDTRAALASCGFPVPASDKRICHWSVYLRPGLFPFYRAVLHRKIPLNTLRQQKREVSQAGAGPRFRLPLPFAS
ncbi:alpha/beta hydrolase [Tropicimonas sp. IMCC6043]|uniref:alpha/beta hydrolase n=1 Tax=Tropicimonas sp. IMCC6043 TaxID=2510645 RepID=UPI00101BADF0|nr:alpha/beta hydrolase [Tropicimonas sp. IMCC6043]RYH11540.1 alpha/beta hydrolase [Tropicimonas sp. IMCC6043]